ncbi:MAG: hypothetical protein ABJN65_04895 [Parasphingorhabdus sp.]
MTLSKPLIAALGSAGIACAALMFWYEWGAAPLSSGEVDKYMSSIGAQTQKPGARHNLPALRAFLEEDDGKPVYTVNMYKFNVVADYPESSDYDGSGEEAYERFSNVMVRLMIERGSHPVFGSSWADANNSRWDRIVIVRYRSRRDLVDLFATDDFAEASTHKWASLREHDRMLVQATHIPDGRYIIMPLGFLIASIVYVVGSIISNRSKSRSNA